MPTLEEIKAIKEVNKEAILSRPNVVGVGTAYKHVGGQATNNLCVVALVSKKVSLSELTPENRIPAMLGEVSTDVVEVGNLVAQQDRRIHSRPAAPGVSLGHYRITAGTFGCVVRDRRTNMRLILSNNHVLANRNNAAPGDSILQPGPNDGGQVPQDILALLLRFIPLRYIGDPAPKPPLPVPLINVGLFFARALGIKSWVDTLQGYQQLYNLMDAAVAQPVIDADISDEIMGVGKITGTMPPALGMAVRKSGLTTGLTTGTVIISNATVTVNYDEKAAQFENQILTTPMSQGGDSGSLVVNGNSPLAVGLLFAGSDKTSICTPIQTVLDALDVSF
jgi:hypothetical protein